jgi:hypothetical protein
VLVEEVHHSTCFALSIGKGKVSIVTVRESVYGVAGNKVSLETAQPGIYSPTGLPFGSCAQD